MFEGVSSVPLADQGSWWVDDARAAHPIPVYAVEERCRCGQPASHKVEETSALSTFHPMTAYLCCDHFRMFVGRCENFPAYGSPAGSDGQESTP